MEINFKPVDRSAAADFEQYALSNFCGDTAFSLLYAWAKRFDYCYMAFEHALLVTGIGINGKRGWIILHRAGEPIARAFETAVRFCDEWGIAAEFEYVDENALLLYQDEAKRLGRKTQNSYSDIFSDYLYEAQDYISLSGGKNKNRRGGMNFLSSHFPNLRMVKYTEDLYPVCMSIFDQWCAAHDCEKCFYGCEKQAFMRFAQNYDSEKQNIYLAYDADRPLAFSAYEKINADTSCCYFHKNAERIRGLTYWLSRCAVIAEDCRFLNLGEDMGLAGMIADKEGLHPCGKIRKYTVTISGE
jgi:hypothetical protein